MLQGLCLRDRAGEDHRRQGSPSGSVLNRGFGQRAACHCGVGRHLSVDEGEDLAFPVGTEEARRAGGRVCVLETNQLRYFGIEDRDPHEPFLATVDAATGQPVGRRALPGSVERLAAPPVLAAGALWLPQVEPLAGTDAAAPGSGAILAMDQATGQLRSQTVLPAPPVAPPLVAGAEGTTVSSCSNQQTDWTT
jgi:hypothetical protein